MIYHVEIKSAGGRVLKGTVATTRKEADALRLRFNNDPLVDAGHATVEIREEFRP